MERRSIALVVAAGAFALVLGSVGCQQTAPAPTDTSAKDEFPRDTGEVETVETVEPTDLSTIYFDYDKSAIRADQRENLQRDAEAINARSALGVVTLQGNCDERGSREFNIALGSRRALTVKRALELLGIDGGRIDVVSFGSEKPVAFGHDEASWRLNRRADIVY